MLRDLTSWLQSLRGKSLDKLLAVEFDSTTVAVRLLSGSKLEPEWNQTFRFADIKRVCFKDGGMLGSDIIYVSLTDREKVAAIPTAAQGGHEFFGALCERGYFPERVWRQAVGDTSGGLHCWPED